MSLDVNTVNPPLELKGFNHILKFYDSSIPESQYYHYGNILGFERGSGKFSIYFKGAKDVNAKDKVEITVTGSTITVDDAIELMINAPLYGTVHRESTAIIEVVSDTVGKSMRSEFSQARITYGTCCSGGGGSTTEFASFTVSGGDNGKSTPNGAYLIPNRDGKAFYEVSNPSAISFANATAQGINFNIAHRDLKLESFVGGVVTDINPSEECATHMKFVLLTDTLATGQTAFNFSVTVLATFAITARNQLQIFEASSLSISIPHKTAYTFAFVPDCSRIETWGDIKGWANISCVV